MHSKQYGNLGEIAVAKDLINKGYFVFTELGDICKSDLIILNDDYKPLKIQVKCVSIKHGKISFRSIKSGPNYKYAYELKHADIYAIYIHEKDIILYLSSKQALMQKEITIRVEPPKNNQNLGVNWYQNYLDLDIALIRGS